ncbi:unnamed protein product [Parnassius apollo]|uniref:(apollo) hypothetical protein n=1 Tax=Parnassius apollo TaxID=110799 RepID=A0A8S3X7U9_PARAO|nr:unnamed protein product [Parnassius apollo]
MNALWVFAIAVGVVAGDVGLGYHYKVPQNSYGEPAYLTSTASATYNSGLTGSTNKNNYNNQYSGSNYYTGYNTHGGLSSTSGQNTGYTGFQTVASSAATGPDTIYYTDFLQPNYQTSSDYSAFNQYQTSGQYQSSAVEKYQQYYDVIQQQPAEVFKHYYVHAAPEEPERPKPRQPIVLPPTQKHYKIIFIKAPSTPAQPPQIIPVPQQNEEKTLVYVLVKKPEEAQNIVLPKLEQKAPTKPEVYFIKYNNKQDSQAVINNIVSDLNKGGNVGSGYSSYTDGSTVYTTSNQGSGSSGPSYTESFSLSGDQGSSSLDSSSAFGSSTFGSGGLSSSSTLGTESSGSNIFGSGSSGTNTFGSGSTSSTFGSGSSTFASGATGTGNYGSSTGTSSSYGSSYDGAKGQSVSISTIDGGVTDNGYDSSSGLSSLSSTASTLTGYDANAISTSQGIPHETYGPPKFKVL